MLYLCNDTSSEVDKSDLRFSNDNEEIGNEPRFRYARLSLLNFRDCKELSLNEIIKHGIGKAHQGTKKIPDELYEYIIQYLC